MKLPPDHKDSSPLNGHLPLTLLPRAVPPQGLLPACMRMSSHDMDIVRVRDDDDGEDGYEDEAEAGDETAPEEPEPAEPELARARVNGLTSMLTFGRGRTRCEWAWA